MGYLDMAAVNLFGQYNFDCCSKDEQKVLLNLFLKK